MSAKKIYDAVVIDGEYTDRNGEIKKSYLTVGSVIQYDDGNMALLMKRTFNPAGVPGNRDIAIRFYAPRDRDGYGATAPAPDVPRRQAPPVPHAAPPAELGFDDDIPF